MAIQDDINDIANAESGESVRSAIISAIQDLNQNGGNAQTLNNHSSDDFTKKAEFDDFVDEEVGQIHLVLDAINKGTSLKVIDLGVHSIGPQGNVLAITVPESVKDRHLLTVDDFYADIVEIAAGSGENVHWTKTDSYDNVRCEYRYAYSALASAIKLHFYAKRASAIVVPDYDVHPYPGQVRENRILQAEAGEAWNYIDVMVPTGGKTEIEETFNENGVYTPTDPNTTWGKVTIDVTAPTPELQTGSVSVGQAAYHQEFNPTAPYVGFSKFTVDVNVPMPSIQNDRQVTMDTSGYINPESGYDAMSTVYVTVPTQPSIQTDRSVTMTASGYINPESGYDAMSTVYVTVPAQPSIQTGKSVTYSSGGTYTVDPSSGYDAMDSVEVTVQTPVVQQSKSVTLSQSGTVTPDPGFDAMEEVVVTVSGGGGGNCNIVDQETWDLYTFDQKKASNLTVIRNSPNNMKGVWYDLHNLGGSDYIPYSQIIICEATIDNFDATSHSWGVGPNPLTLENLLTANADGIGVDIKGQQSHDGVYCDLEDINTDFTAYLVFRYSQAYSYGRILCSSYQSTYNEETYICQSSNTGLKAGTWGSDPDIGTAHTVDTYIAVAMRNNGGVASFFKNTTKGQDKNPNHFGRYIAIASSYPNGYSYATNLTVAYVGIVGEAESDLTILDNIDVLMNKFNIV